MVYLSLIALVKKEHHYIKEWLSYYRSIGVEKFFIFNNNKPDKTRQEMLKLPFAKDIVVSNFLDYSPNRIHNAYKKAIKFYKEQTEWMIFCNIDEFYMFSTPTNMQTFLRDYRKHSAVAVPTMQYGSSGYINRPQSVKDTICLSNYLYRQKKICRKINTIVKPADITGFIDLNVWKTTKHTVTENYDLLPNFLRKDIRGDFLYKKFQKASKLRINNYITKSQQDFLQKLQKTHPCDKEKINPILFEEINKNNVYDDLSLNYINQTFKAMN